MCELLALAFNEPVTASLSFRGFRHRAAGNPHGWGLATFDGPRATIIKEARRADRSDTAASVAGDATLTSRIFIGHVRYGNVGGVSHQNTHPFVRRVRGSDLVLAHNGTLWRDCPRPQTDDRCRPEGATDSELALCVLVAWLMDGDIPLTDFRAIHDRLRRLNDAGSMNLLFSDGERLFAYHDKDGYNDLFFTQRKTPFPRVQLRDETWQADLPAEKSPTQRGHVIATRPLTKGEEWTSFAPGGLMVFKDGDVAYPG